MLPDKLVRNIHFCQSTHFSRAVTQMPNELSFYSKFFVLFLTIV